MEILRIHSSCQINPLNLGYSPVVVYNSGLKQYLSA